MAYTLGGLVLKCFLSESRKIFQFRQRILIATFQFFLVFGPNQYYCGLGTFSPIFFLNMLGKKIKTVPIKSTGMCSVFYIVPFGLLIGCA